MLFNLILMRASHGAGADISFAHRGHKEQVMKNDKVTNEQQAQNKLNRKKKTPNAWGVIKWLIRLLYWITRAVDFFEGGDE